MLQFVNETPFHKDSAVLLDKEGNQIWTVILKGTYSINKKSRLQLASDQEPVLRAPHYSGEPGKSSLLRESDVTLEHEGTSVLLNGTAYTPNSVEKEFLDVHLQVGARLKSLRVFGDRHWKKTALGMGLPVPTRPVPFKKMPINYESAFGGFYETAEGECLFEERNPVGKGYYKKKPENGDPLPNIENPKELIKTWKDRPEPAGFGVIASNWLPRRDLAGTFDDTWKMNRRP